MLLEITVNKNKWNVHKNPGSLEGAWITAQEIGQKLGYENPGKSVGKIYERYSASFIDKIDTFVLKNVSKKEFFVILTKNSQTQEKRGNPNVRLFSERGALKIIRHSETPIADMIMDEVFEVFLKARKEAIIKEKALELFLREFPANWTKTFPDHFMEAIARLYRIRHYTPGQTCLAMASFIKTYIYSCAPDGIYEEILKKNPGDVLNREFKHHQLLTSEAQEWLKNQITSTLALMRASEFDPEIFKNAHRKAYPKFRPVEDFLESGELKLQLCFGWE